MPALDFRRMLFRLGALAVFGALASCATLRTDLPKPASTSLPPVADTPTTRYVASETNAHGEASGFPTSYWLQIVLALTGVVMVVGGIVRTVRR